MRRHTIYPAIAVVSAASIGLAACSNPFNPEIAKGSSLYPEENTSSSKVVHVEVASDFLAHVRVFTLYGADARIPGCSRWTGDGGNQPLSVGVIEKLQKIDGNRAAVDIHIDKFIPGHCKWQGESIGAAPYIGKLGGVDNVIIAFETPHDHYDRSYTVFTPLDPPIILNYTWRCSPVGHPCDGAFKEYPSEGNITVSNAWPPQGRAYLFLHAIRVDTGDIYK